MIFQIAGICYWCEVSKYMYQFTLALEMRACPQICLLSHISKSRSHWKSSQAAQAPRRPPNNTSKNPGGEITNNANWKHTLANCILNWREKDDTLLLDDRKRQLKERRNRWQPVSKLTIRQNCENTKSYPNGGQLICEISGRRTQ